jgi:small membrane protein
MVASQVVLLALVLAFAVYVFRLRSTATDRVAYLLMALGGAALIIRPEWTNQLAHLLGVGRGADLLFYFFIVFCLFHFATTAATLRRLQRDLASVVSHVAQAMPLAPSDSRTEPGRSP